MAEQAEVVWLASKLEGLVWLALAKATQASQNSLSTF